MPFRKEEQLVCGLYFSFVAFLLSYFIFHDSPSLNQKTPSRQGRRSQRRGTTLLPDAPSCSDSLGRANGRWSSPATGLHRCHLPLSGRQGEFDLLAFRTTCRALTGWPRLAGEWSTTPAV